MESSGTAKGKAEERILAAAINLFGSRGYNGVSTRDIANSASVNEVTIYRHYPRKRDLYIAALSAELERVRLGGAKLKEIADSPDSRQAVLRAFHLIESALSERPEMLRLLLYGALESTSDVDILVRRHLGEFIQILVGYLEPWARRGETFGQSAHAVILGLVAIAVFHQSMVKFFPQGSINIADADSAARFLFTDI